MAGVGKNRLERGVGGQVRSGRDRRVTAQGMFGCRSLLGFFSTTLEEPPRKILPVFGGVAGNTGISIHRSSCWCTHCTRAQASCRGAEQSAQVQVQSRVQGAPAGPYMTCIQLVPKLRRLSLCKQAKYSPWRHQISDLTLSLMTCLSLKGFQL